MKCKESAPTADFACMGSPKKDWQMKVLNRAAVTGVDYPAALSVIVPYPALCVAVVSAVLKALSDFLCFIRNVIENDISTNTIKNDNKRVDYA